MGSAVWLVEMLGLKSSSKGASLDAICFDIKYYTAQKSGRSDGIPFKVPHFKEEILHANRKRANAKALSANKI